MCKIVLSFVFSFSNHLQTIIGSIASVVCMVSVTTVVSISGGWLQVRAAAVVGGVYITPEGSSIVRPYKESIRETFTSLKSRTLFHSFIWGFSIYKVYENNKTLTSYSFHAYFDTGP